jgi:16S rRNA (guanine527-N7)-methyltransferase
MFHVKHDPLEAPSVSRETSDRLATYAALLLKWNQRINLVSRQTETELWERHFEDALQLIPLIPTGVMRGIDFGSGAGFPGLVLAIATGVAFDLIESDLRKAAFLREVAAETGAPVRVHAVRIEAAAIPPARLITARALAPLTKLLPMIAPFLLQDGVALLPKGTGVDEELTAAQPHWHMKIARHASVTDPNGVILRLTEVHRA